MSQGMLELPLPATDNLCSSTESVTQRRVLALAQAALVLAGVVVLGSYALLAAAHANDRFQINFVSGVYSALAAELNAGRFYPEVYDGAHYGGTRYVPGQFVLHAGLARITGEYLFSGKLLTYAATLALLLQLYIMLRRLDCRRSLSFALLGLVVTSGPGFLACTTIRGDLLPVVFQVAALLLAADGKSLRRAGCAGLCCTLAILTKYSAVWAPAAIGLWYLLRDRRCCLLFVTALVGTLLPTLGLLHYLTDGRMMANFKAVSTSEFGYKGIALAPLLFLWRLGRAGVLMTVLLPLVLIEGILAVRQRRLTIFHYAFAACLPVMLVIYSDMGADTNHLLDVVVLALPLIGGCLAALYRLQSERYLLRLAATLAVGWLLYVSWANSMIFPLLDVLRHVERGEQAKPLAGVIGDNEALIAEDPWVCITRGQQPTMLDPFGLARLGQTRPQAVQELIHRIERQEFQHVVLLQRLEDSNPHDRYDWQVRHFGPPVVSALREHYTLETTKLGYFVYRPRITTLAQR